MEVQLTYSDFRRAAERHYWATDTLLKSANHREDIFWNAYYLSGYIVECGLKYAIFSTRRDIKFRLNDKLAGANFKYKHYDLHSHDLMNLADALAETCSERANIFNQSDEHLKKMLKAWTSEVRYSKKFAQAKYFPDIKLTEDLMQRYLIDIKKIHHSLTTL